MCPGIIGDEGEILCADGDNICLSYLFLLQCKAWILFEFCLKYIVSIIGPFGTINQRAALYSHLAAVCLNLLVGSYQAWLHVEVNLHNIAFLPLATNRYISASRFYIRVEKRMLEVVYADGEVERFAICVCV